jgi:hypothetical protein
VTVVEAATHMLHEGTNTDVKATDVKAKKTNKFFKQQILGQ